LTGDRPIARPSSRSRAMPPERIQKLLARAGMGSRRQCEELIADGRVTLNAVVASLGDRADPEIDAVAVDGIGVDLLAHTVVYALHKPAGVVTTAADPQGRPTVLGLVPPVPRVFPVGRLDILTEGLLLLTNDGELAQRITHPRHGMEKTYLVEAAGALGDRDLAQLRLGIELDDGMTSPARVRRVTRLGDRVSFEITVHEGRNRQVRRMVEALGGEVKRLVRMKVGPVVLGRLGKGAWRRLSPGEIERLRRVAWGEGPSQTGHGLPGASRRQP
jgi:23S rRNA pseudouridine2605 synthase